MSGIHYLLVFIYGSLDLLYEDGGNDVTETLGSTISTYAKERSNQFSNPENFHFVMTLKEVTITLLLTKFVIESCI